MVGFKSGIKKNLKLTENGLWPVCLETKAQIDWKKIKIGEAQEPKYIIENKCSQKS